MKEELLTLDCGTEAVKEQLAKGGTIAQECFRLAQRLALAESSDALL